MATPTPTSQQMSMSIEENGLLPDSKPKVSVPLAGAEVRASMLKTARISIARSARSSRNSTPAPLESAVSMDEPTPFSFRSAESDIIAVTPKVEESKSWKQLAEEQPLSPLYKFEIMGFLQGLLDRLSVFLHLPHACKISDSSSIELENIPSAQETLLAKRKLLAAANLVHYSLFHPFKVSKFEIEATWLHEILSKTIKEVEEHGTFDTLLQVVEADDAKEKRLPAALEHTKLLKEKTEMMKVTMGAEAEAHKETIREWAKNLTIHKQVMSCYPKSLTHFCVINLVTNMT
jgi:hypothetical protein